MRLNFLYPLLLNIRLHGSSHTVCIVKLVGVGPDPKNIMHYELLFIREHLIFVYVPMQTYTDQSEMI